LAELARRFPADRPLMLAAEGQGRIVGGALALSGPFWKFVRGQD
jgi:hypothetical protein